jgi:hypothetical protein
LALLVLKLLQGVQDWLFRVATIIPNEFASHDNPLTMAQFDDFLSYNGAGNVLQGVPSRLAQQKAGDMGGEPVFSDC